ncbi:MAG: UbiA family prenyltransferase, partial [Deltaproteobacteria bacterium]|nr:UbiA family prenyltransferase [Deltaproteobacteria bacterium]
PTIWTNVLAAVVLSSSVFSWLNFLILAFSLSCFYSAGICLNDIIDAPIDRLNKPYRPIPSGRISPGNAYRFTLGLIAAGFVFLLIVPYRQAVFAAVLLVVLIVAYDRFHKAHPASVLLIAGCRLMIFVISALALNGWVRGVVWIAGFTQFFYVVFMSLVARYENKRPEPFKIPVIPIMIASISIIDGVMMALFASPLWLIAGFIGAFLMLTGQRYVRGD